MWDSRTNNVERFIEKLNVKNVKIHKKLEICETFVLVTYTTGFGLVPDSTKMFLESNNYFLLGVASSGNMNWGKSFAKAADVISEKYNVPIIHKFELSGTNKDVEIFLEGLREING